MRLGHPEQARAFFQAAGSLAPYLFEPHHNYAKLAEEVNIIVCFGMFYGLKVALWHILVVIYIYVSCTLLSSLAVKVK
jgi:hypothetical protein